MLISAVVKSSEDYDNGGYFADRFYRNKQI